MALATGAEEPRVDFPPIRTYRFDGQSYSEGVEVHDLDGVGVRIYCAEKTLADCFKFRNRIGLDIAVEALRSYRERKTLRSDELVRYASICRMRKVMQPYLEAIL